MSKGAKHTPGPWAMPGSANLVGTVGEGRRLIAETHGENSEANAVLIEAAPDMYEAGEALAKCAALVIERWTRGDLAAAVNALDDARDEWTDAVTKVKGE